MRYKRIKINNFKSLKDVEIDFDNNKSVFIYGANGSGKTHIVQALCYFQYSVTQFYNQSILGLNDVFKLKEERESKLESRLIDAKEEIFRHISKYQHNMNIKTIGSSESTKLEYEFIIDKEPSKEKTAIYSIEIKDNIVISEKLKYPINKNMVTIFSISKNKKNINDNLFSDKYRNVIDDLIERYYGKNSLLSILYKEKKECNEDYINKRVNESIFDIFDFLNVNEVRSDEEIESKYLIKEEQFNLVSGVTTNRSILNKYEKKLNFFFKALYADIKKVKYRIEKAENGFDYKLYFEKLLYGEKVSIPFSEESTGTKELINIFPYLYQLSKGKIVIIDQMDTSTHDLLFSELIESIKEDIKGQLIVTTHNTFLMKKLDKKEIYIISVDNMGVKDIKSLKQGDVNIRKDHNIRKQYMNDNYSGTPYLGYFSLELLEDDN